jgi:hypothetical protein
MNPIRRRLTYANVMSSIAIFLVLGGATAFAASQLGKNSVGSKQIKKNAVTAAKIKKNAVTAAKIKANAVTGAKIKDGSITGAKVDLGTLGTVPSSATTETVKGAKVVLALGQEATLIERGPLKLIAKCETPEENASYISPRVYIFSATPGSVFTSWQDGSRELGPTTPAQERQINEYSDGGSTGLWNYESPSEGGVSASAASGSSFNAWVGVASEKNTGTCWYWANATILG